MQKPVFVVAAFALALSGPAAGQEGEEPAQPMAAEASATASVYDEFVAVMSPDALHEASFANTVRQLRGFYNDTPEIAALDAQCPGLIDAIFRESEPIMREYHFEEARMIRTILGEVIREELTEQQVREGIELYGSELGQKVILSAGANQNLQNTMDSAVSNENGDVDRAAFDRDLNSTTSRIIRSLTTEELAEFGRMAMGSTFLADFRKVDPILKQRKFELLNSPALAPYQARMEAAMAESMQSHLDACE